MVGETPDVGKAEFSAEVFADGCDTSESTLIYFARGNKGHTP
jgi:hypothetical protein